MDKDEDEELIIQMTCPNEGHKVNVITPPDGKVDVWICPPCRESKLTELRGAARSPEEYRDASVRAEEYAKVEVTG